jgi:hypothetical protein
VRPGAQHGVAPARVVLGDHADVHRGSLEWTATVTCATSAGR